MIKQLFTARIALAALLLTAFGSRVGATEILEVKSEENSPVIRMELNRPSSGTMEVVLMDSEDEILLRNEIVPGTLYQEQFDFSDLEEGAYRLVSTEGPMTYNRVLEVSSTGIQMVEQYYTFEPQFRLQGDLLEVHHINQGGGAVEISIESLNGFSYDRGYVSTDLVFQKVISLEGIEKGYYTLHLATESDFHTYDFRVD